jgi:hypothetical protein
VNLAWCDHDRNLLEGIDRAEAQAEPGGAQHRLAGRNGMHHALTAEVNRALRKANSGTHDVS